MIEFKPKKGLLHAFIHLGTPAVFCGICTYTVLSMINDREHVSLLMFLFVILILFFCGLFSYYFLYVWFRSRYYIDGNAFHYKFGLMNGRIPIDKITTIKKSTYPTDSSNNPTFTLSGYKIYYSVSEEKHVPRKQLHVSPLEVDLFLKSMLEANSNIVIKE